MGLRRNDGERIGHLIHNEAFEQIPSQVSHMSKLPPWKRSKQILVATPDGGTSPVEIVSTDFARLAKALGASDEALALVLQQARFEATSWKKYSKCPSALAEMRLLKTTAAHETDISSEPKVPEDPPQPQGQDRAASSPAQLA